MPWLLTGLNDGAYADECRAALDILGHLYAKDNEDRIKEASEYEQQTNQRMAWCHRAYGPEVVAPGGIFASWGEADLRGRTWFTQQASLGVHRLVTDEHVHDAAAIGGRSGSLKAGGTPDGCVWPGVGTLPM